MSDAWATVDAILADAVAARVTPGASLCVARRVADVWSTVTRTVGRLGGDEPAEVTTDTVYDLASVTKPFTAWAAVRLAATGVLDLHAPLHTFLPEARELPAGTLTLDALLSHRAGLPAWRPLFREVLPAEAGGDGVRRALLREVLCEACGVTEAAVYSDLGYILAGFALEAASGLGLDATLARAEVLGALRFGAEPRRCAPTEDCAWRGAVQRGAVHDENAFALGGVAGHAGLFGTAPALCARGVAAVDALAAGDADLRVMLAPRAGGTNRLGWDTKSPDASSAGARMGARTFGHLGFTGTSLWCDPDAGVVVALLTNRVHRSREGTGIRALRPAVHDAVMRALGA